MAVEELGRNVMRHAAYMKYWSGQGIRTSYYVYGSASMVYGSYTTSFSRTVAGDGAWVLAFRINPDTSNGQARLRASVNSTVITQMTTNGVYNSGNYLVARPFTLGHPDNVDMIWAANGDSVLLEAKSYSGTNYADYLYMEYDLV